MLNDDVTYFDSFGVEHISTEIRRFIGNKNIQTTILRVQAYDSVVCGYFCIRFIDFMLVGNASLDCRTFFRRVILIETLKSFLAI